MHMNRWTHLLLLTFVLAGAGCTAGLDSDSSVDVRVLEDLSTQLDDDLDQRQAEINEGDGPEDEAICTYDGQTLQVGESYDDGCNTHTCQQDGTVVSTEMGCEAEGDVSGADTSQAADEVNEDEEDESSVLEVSMEAGNFFFSPDVITAEPGQEIELTFEANAGTHTFVIDEIDFSTGVSVNKTVTFTAPTAPGSYAYYCDVGSHRALGMEGTLIVK